MKRKKDPNRRSAKFTENEMRRAVLMVAESGKPLNRVSREEGLCKKTLKSYVDKYVNCAEAKKKTIRFRPNYEINQVFTNDLEKMFENDLLAMDKTVRKLNRSILREAAYEFAVKCNVHVPKTWNLRKKAGLDWMYSYLKRHPLVKRTIIDNKQNANTKSNACETVVEDIVVCGGDGSTDPPFEEIVVDVEMAVDSDSEDRNKEESSADEEEGTDDYFFSYLKVQPSATGDHLNDVSVKTPLDEFHENLSGAYKAIARDHWVSSERVYNLDEIALVVENPPYYKSNNVVVTACCFVNAAGGTAPPFMVFPRRRVKKRTPVGCPEGTSAVGAKNGLMDADAFVQALRHLQQATQSSPHHKIVLIMDDDDCHVTVASMDCCRACGIELVTVPPHHAKQLLPIGRQPFETLKACFNRAYRKFRLANPAAYISMHDVGSLFGAVYPHAFAGDKIVTAFRETGVYPLDEPVLMDPNSLVRALDERDYLAAAMDNDVELVITGVADSGPDASSGDDERDTSGGPFKSPMDEFFENLVDARRVLREHGALAPERIYNMDEVELVVHNPRTPDVRVLACCYASAAGDSIPPFLLYPEEEFDPGVLEGGIEGMRAVTLSAATELRDVFVMLLEHFRECVDASPQNRAMLIVDADASHVSVGAMDFVREHGIELVTVPPYVSEPMQPLEKIAFRTLVWNFREACDRLMAKFARYVTVRDIAPLLKEVYPQTFSNAKIRDGFRLAGLWPLNRTKFPKEDELCAMYAAEWPPYAKTTAGPSGNSLSGNETDDVEESDTEESEWDCESGSVLATNEALQFFENLENAFRDLQETNDLKPSNIYVVGELELQPASGQDVLVTACCFANADGSTLPPFLVSASRIDENAVKWAPADTATVTSQNGRVDDETFLKMLGHFKKHARVPPHRRTLLIADDEAASKNESAARFCGAGGVILHSTPASLSKKLHPLRRSVFESLARAIVQDAEADSERRTRDGDRSVSAECLVAAFGRAYSWAFAPDRIVDAFEECDIVPCSEDETEESESAASGEAAEEGECSPPARRLNTADTSAAGNPLPPSSAAAERRKTENTFTTSDPLPVTGARAIPESESAPSAARPKTANTSPTSVLLPLTVVDGVGERTSPEYASTYPRNIEDFIIEEEIELTIDDVEYEKEGAVPNADMAGVTLVCYLCSAEFVDYLEFIEHGMSSHRGCYGGKTLTSNHRTFEHEEAGTGAVGYSCPTCGKVCDTKEEFVQHRRENILKMTPICQS